MALVSLGGAFPFPSLPTHISASPDFGSLLLDAASEKAAYIIQAPKTGSIRKVHFLTRVTTTGAIVDVRLETISATDGHPTGTLLGTDTNISHTIADADDNEMLITAALTADAAVTVGDEFAVVIVNPAVSAGNFNVAIFNDHHSGFPYHDLFTAAYAKGTLAPVLVLEYSDATIVPVEGVYCHETESTVASSAATYRGNELSFPFTCRVCGYWWWTSALAGNPIVRLIDSDGTTAALSDTLDADKLGSGAIPIRRRFNSTKVLTAGTAYWLAALPDGAGSVTWRVKDYDTQAIREGAEIAGAFQRYMEATSPTEPASWTATETRIAWMGVLIDQLDDGAGAGGGAINLLGGLVR